MNRAPVILGGFVCVLVVGGAAFTAARLIPSPPLPVLRITAASAWTPVAGTAPAVPVPSSGAFALDVTDAAGTRQVAVRGAAEPHPMASVTKTMTALLVLELRPLGSGRAGPGLVMTADDVADYTRIAAAGGSVAPVKVGEVISERQLLLGLMLPSANNMALTLARWVDGSVEAFVARMNSRAASLGMTQTHFADPDGLSAATTASAADLVVLGEAVVRNPDAVAITSTVTDTLPDGTVISNLDALLTTQPTWIGIKTGWTPQAGGCLLFAARYVVAPGAQPLTVVGAVLGQPPDPVGDREHPELGSALRVARDAVTAVLEGYAPLQIPASAVPPATAQLADRGGRVLTDTALVGSPVALVLPLGEALRVTVRPGPLAAGLPVGSTVATVTVLRGAQPLGTWSLVTTTAIVAPSWTDRLLRS